MIFEREYDGWGSLFNDLSPIPDIFTEAAGRGYWIWAEEKYHTHTKATLFNWLGSHNSVAQSLYEDIFANLPAGKKSLDAIIGKTRDYKSNSDIAASIVSGLLNTPNEWKVFDPNRPYSFAFCDNQQCMIDISKQEQFLGLPNSYNPKTGGFTFSVDITKVYFKYDYSYIATFNQIEYWSSP